MPPTTRSMQGRLSSTSQASSPYVQAGPSRGTAQPGTPQRIARGPVSGGGDNPSSDDDDDDDDEDEDDDDEGEDDDDDESDEEDDNDGNDATNNAPNSPNNDTDSYSDDDDQNSVWSKVIKIFATGEPNGLTKSEITDPRFAQSQANEAS